MVNVLPIPPLLCSTPPPIDFGEDNEDMDVMPPTLDAVSDDEFDGFLTVDDAKDNEPLPSPRPFSVCDLPPVSIYDGLMPSDVEEDPKNTETSTPPPQYDQISKDSNESKQITEAFNFDVKSTYEDKNHTEQKEVENHSMKMARAESAIKQLLETDSENFHQNSQDVSKNIKDLTIDTSSIANTIKSGSSNKINMNCMQNVVYIEDLEDDLSDDELYSPKSPKNFIATDSLNDYFKIEEIKTAHNKTTETKSISKDVYVKSLDSLDNNESVSPKNDNILNPLSSDSTTEHNFDTPPPLKDDAISIDDDFGDFADFQDFGTSATVTPVSTQNFVNNTVPVNDINFTQNNNFNNSGLDGFNDFNNYNTDKEYLHQNSTESEHKEDKFEKFTSRMSSMANDKFEEKPKQHSLDLEIKSKETSNVTCGDFNKVNSTVEIFEDVQDFVADNENYLVSDNNSNLGNCCGDLNAAVKILNNDENFGNFAEFSMPYQNINKKEMIMQTNEVSKDIPYDDDEFDDFAEFESHSVQPQINENFTNTTPAITTDLQSSINKSINKYGNVEEDDDDFGDFSTAQPITLTASSSTETNTSQYATVRPNHVQPPLHNLNERISKILQLMFTSAIDSADITTSKHKTRKIQDIPFTSIDAAKALEYQWLNSDTRHSFIRSLGIDSRNILFGENWNPLLPRFAANLSFNPLKPMKPTQIPYSTADASSVLEPIPANTSESTNTINVSVNVKKEILDLERKSPSVEEKTTNALKDNTLISAVTATADTYMPYDPPPAEPVSLTEEKFSKTPPISEMESVTAFSSPLPTTTIEKELPLSQMEDDFDLRDVEESLKNTFDINEVVVKSTFTGSFKETHIYTPSKTNTYENQNVAQTVPPTTSPSPTKAAHIDFDYEKAAMGVIIDETVVKKEYRDVEYNPPFTMESLSKPATTKTNLFEANVYVDTNASTDILRANDLKLSLESSGVIEEQDSNEDFSEFQSVTTNGTLSAQSSAAVTNSKSLEVSKNTTVSYGGMILSPAILIPQAISLENQKPKIEWGDSTTTINPEELARIEELFPEPKSLKSSNCSNSSQKSTPTHQVASAPSISATVANKEFEGNVSNVNDDDDDWSDFVSVTVTNNASTNRGCNNNNTLTKCSAGSPFKQKSPVVTQRTAQSSIHNNSNNDDEWSEFVSSAPPSLQTPSYRVPQFNSGAWQNANFYNNPLSMYHKGPLNVPTAATHTSQKSIYNNNNNYNILQQPYQIANNIPSNNTYQQQQQKIHVMQNFSTAPVPTPERLATAVAPAGKNNQFQSIGSAKVAPSIALIPDLGFVAPAIPTHTSFINSLPKPSINTKK